MAVSLQSLLWGPWTAKFGAMNQSGSESDFWGRLVREGRVNQWERRVKAWRMRLHVSGSEFKPGIPKSKRKLHASSESVVQVCATPRANCF